MTTHLAAVTLYTGILALVGIWLSVRIGMVRGQVKINMGDGGNPRLIRAMRGQANFIEYVPLALFIMLLFAMLGAPIYVIHIAGVALTVGRVAHAWHFTRDDAASWQRGLGAMTSVLVIALGGLGLITMALIEIL